jgi:hypothetical protein
MRWINSSVALCFGGLGPIGDGICPATRAPGDIGVEAMVADEMLARWQNLGDHAPGRVERDRMLAGLVLQL